MVQTQNLTVKKSKSKEFKPQKSKLDKKKSSTLPRINEPAKFNYKNKKKEWLKKKKNSILAIENNAIKGKKKQTSSNGNQVTYYNYHKKSHFTNKYIKPKN